MSIYVGDKKVANNYIIDNTVYSVPIGSIIPYSSTTLPKGFLLCNGSEISKTDYADLYKIIGDKFGAATDTTKFKLPDLRDKFIQGANDNLGESKSAGLPNIEGEINLISAGRNRVNGLDGGGCISAVYYPEYMALVYDENNKNLSQEAGSQAVFDASKSNSIYGNSETVQPPAICLCYIIKATKLSDIPVDVVKINKTKEEATEEYNKALELSKSINTDIQAVKSTVDQVAKNTNDIGKVAATDSAQSQSVDGNNVINIDNAIGVGVKSLVVYGNSIIDGTPTLDSPATIKHCNVNKITVSDGTNSKEFDVNSAELRGDVRYGRDTLDLISGKITRCTKVRTFKTANINFKIAKTAAEGMSVISFYAQYVLQETNIRLYACDKLPVLTDIKPAECTQQGIYCDKFNVYFILKASITTLDEFKTWLAANPITIEYVSKKVTTESIEPSTVSLFDGKNIISNNCNVEMSTVYAVDSTSQMQKMIDDFALADGAVAENHLADSIKTKVNQLDGVDYRTAEFDYKTYNGTDLKTSNMTSKTTGNAPTFTVASTAVTCVIDESGSTGVGWAQLRFDFYNTQIPVRRSYNRLMRVDYMINDGTDDFTFNVSGVNYGFDTLIDVDKTVGNHTAYIYLSGYQQSEEVNIQIGCNAGKKVSITINSISWIYDSTQKYQIDNTVADNIGALGKGNGKYKFFVAPNANFAMLSSKSDVADKLSTTFAGKKIVYYGDSITAMGGWTDTVAKYFGAIEVNLGIGGTTASGTADNCGVSDTRINQIPTDAAIVTVLFGANDYGASKGIGTLPDDPFTTTTTFDGTTYIGALAEIVRKITLRVPTARIILMCPSWRSGDKDGNEDSKNNNGNTIIDYGNAVKTVGRRLGCPVIDLYNDMGVNVFNRSTCFPETSFPVHPNAKGKNRIAGLVINEIKKFDL